MPDAQITGICFIGSSWMYKTDQDGSTTHKDKRPPCDLNPQWKQWAERNKNVWGPPPIYLNGVEKCLDGKIKIYYR